MFVQVCSILLFVQVQGPNHKQGPSLNQGQDQGKEVAPSITNKGQDHDKTATIHPSHHRDHIGGIIY